MSNYLYIAQYVDRFGGSCPSHKKIGIGENVPARMRSLSDTKGTIDVMSLAVWKTKDDTSIQKIELMLHQRFADRRLNGEWFSDDKDDLLPLIEDLVATIETIEKIELSEIPGTLPSPIGTKKGHFDFVSSPKGRRRDTNKEAIIGQLQEAYAHLVSRLPRDYVALNDNGPYIRANANGTPFWIEPRASGIKLNFRGR